ncbi:hypothetical protein BDN72DRAFT_876184 [Pluteus cervinus]|uniref:Uncharacterized protein n=1 Tax=Pluteus cervinus TaxID=181527 RepID=A0ACD3B4Q2_9AGAR|nr:hypothetical protein BDN72DRAFT_876184 [Pluteus cervinus]
MSETLLAQVTYFPKQSEKPTSLKGDNVLKTLSGIQIEDAAIQYRVTELKPTSPLLPAPEVDGATARHIKFLPENTTKVQTSESNPSGLFGAPVTEICFATLKSEEHRTTWEVGVLSKMFKGLPECPGVLSCAWGRAEEDSMTYMLAIGWASYEAHQEATKPEKAQQALAFIRTMLDVDQKHASLNQVEL